MAMEMNGHQHSQGRGQLDPDLAQQPQAVVAIAHHPDAPADGTLRAPILTLG
jgi:hypothetical protein